MKDADYLRYKTAINVQYDDGMDAVKLERATSLKALDHLRKLVSGTNSHPVVSGPSPDKAKRGAVLESVKGAIDTMVSPGTFTVVDVEVTLGEGFAKRQSISQALKSLEKKAVIAVSEPGKGKRATIYRRIPQTSTASQETNPVSEGAEVDPVSTS